MDYNGVTGITFGAEYEFSDICRTTELPSGASWDDNEQDIVNSDLRAIDPRSTTYTIGGEINTSPTDTINEQINIFNNILNTILPLGAKANWRSHLHLHISWKELRENVEVQKKSLKYIQDNIMDILDYNYNPTKDTNMTTSAWRYAIIDRAKMPDWKFKFCQEAKDCKDFYDSHQKVTDGRVLPQTTRRYAVNFFSLKKHGTIEYRALYMTMNPKEILDSFMFLLELMTESVKDNPKSAKQILTEGNYEFPKEIPYNHEQQLGWEKTNTKKN